jgi:broad specificity phosphatase PhoE
MAIYFARHGKTVAGEEKRFEGISDSELSPRGKEQAERLGLFFKNRDITKIVSSPLKRNRQTADIVARLTGAQITVDNTWREMSYGAWDGVKKEDLRDRPIWQERENNKYFFIHPGRGESYDALYHRLEPVFRGLIDNFPPDNILIITHCGVLRAVNKYFNKLSPEETIAYSPPHDEALAIDKKSGNLNICRIKF